ncbi:metal ABC transporter substrate-binding protein [Paenibacillus dokdonensis]|uniref:Metal ABC transporter substrate-binding protein n=1 Tax=Paenibacillus dokdonensis TaxID=2567944 RepID=A0ABU6GUR4_9BACL|nr:metal ABC transporter substrate-binding protein [Paenibacillus dokdonensis]MEC0243467.1 metal ABC transporter substrate-binding protein [Paenibacillus dokdonensis]
MKWRLKAGTVGSVILLMIILAVGCGPESQGKIVEGKVNVVTTFYPIYEFAKAIGGEDANVINLLPAGVEPHDWTPRSQDIVNTSKAQLFFYNGAGLEGWVPQFLKGLNRDSKVKAYEVSQGIKLIEADEEADHDHEGEGHKDKHHVDPHTWVSPKSAMMMAENMKNSYIEADPVHKDAYTSRYMNLKKQLEELDSEFSSNLNEMPRKEIVVSHEAFGYLARDYGLTQHAIMGLSPDAEPRARDLLQLSKLVKEKGIHYIFFEELVSDRLAKTLASETGAEVLVLNPVEGLTEDQLKRGDDYFSLMRNNLTNLILALQE